MDTSRLAWLSRLTVLLLAPAVAAFPSSAPAGRTALFWLGPYANITTVEGYSKVWHQWAANRRPGYIAAGSAFALKRNGTVGFADTSAGEGLYGDLMAQFGFPALRKMNITTLAMVYATHTDGIDKAIAKPAHFVAQLVALAEKYDLQGFDLDYEPQDEYGKPLSPTSARWLSDAFWPVVAKLTAALKPSGRIVTVDFGQCQRGDDNCAAIASAGVVHANMMDSFGVNGVESLQLLEGTDGAQLGQVWSPGFEPAGMGNSTFHEVTAYMASKPGVYRSMSTWGASTNPGPGDQPQWFFDAVNAFLDAPDLQS